ncbi:MAG: hypothetical protein V1827_01680 [Candidatus Micrarchaeota archaeon]
MRLATFVVLSLLLGLAFAAPPQPWAGTAFTALMLSLFILAVLYMVSMAFSLNDLKFLATEEFYQLIMTGVMVAVLFSAEATTNQMFSSIAPNLQDAGLERINATLDTQVNAYNIVKGYMIKVVPESTRSQYCGLSGAGFNIAPCGSYSALTPPLTISLQAISLSIAELSSLKVLTLFAKTYSFTLLLPIGILLRTLKFTRGAGALFIGLAVSLYLFVPIAAIFMDDVTAPGEPSVSPIDIMECDTQKFSTEVGFSYYNADNVKDIYDDLLEQINDYLYLFLVRGTLFSVAVLTAFFATFRWISKLAGAEVDISALMRIA